MKKKLFLLSAFCICMSFVAGSCEDLTIPPVVPPPSGNDYKAISLYTQDVGGTWNVNDIIDPESGQMISAQCLVSLTADISNLLIVANNNKVLRSTNFGANWFSLPSNSNEKYAITNAPTDGKGFVVGFYTQRTTDNGSTWFYVDLNESHYHIATAFFNQMQGILIPRDPGDTTYVTTDGGYNWTFGSVIPTGNYINAIHSVNSTEAVVCGNNGTILKTTDVGATWIQITSSTTENLTSIEISNSVGVIVGEHGTILHSSDGGNSWLLMSVYGVSNNLKKVYNDPGSLWWIVGDNIILQAGSGFLWGVVRNSTNEYYTDIFTIKGAGVVVGSRRLSD